MATDNARLRFTLDPGSVFVEGPIDPQLAFRCCERFAANPAVGAQVVFVGQVRADEIEVGTVTGIEYSAHEGMALKAFGELVARTAGSIQLLDLELRHSLGYVPVGGASLLIAVATGHREEAYRASRELLEAIKQEVPIYGRELTNQDRSSWKINR